MTGAAAVRRVIESLNGSLECLYWMLGTHDGIGIAQLPASTHAAALSTMITSTGAFKAVQTPSPSRYPLRRPPSHVPVTAGNTRSRPGDTGMHAPPGG